MSKKCPLCDELNLCGLSGAEGKASLSCWCQRVQLVKKTPSVEVMVEVMVEVKDEVIIQSLFADAKTPLMDLEALAKTKQCLCLTCLKKLNVLLESPEVN